MATDTLLVIPWRNLLLTVIGLYMIATALGGILVPTRWRRILDELAASPTLSLYGGILALLIGITVMALAAPSGARSLLFAIGALSVIKGIIFLVNPPGLYDFYRRIITPDNGRIISIALFAAGIAVLLFALTS